MFNQKQASVISTNIPKHQTVTEGLSATHTTSLTNQEFYVMCVHTGRTAKTAVREFLALLPEAEDRQVYLEHGMNSIFGFAAKLGGVSREQVQRVLQLKDKFKPTPQLMTALVSGQIPVAKLARIASVATPDNQDFWLNQAQLLSNRALETLVRDSKSTPTANSVHVHTSNPNKTEKISLPPSGTQEIPQSDELQLSSEIKERLLSLQNKGLDLNQLLGELLDQREEQIKQEKQEIARELSEKNQIIPTSNKQGVDTGSSKSRYIPKKIRSIVKMEHGEKCAHSNCTNKSVNIHHTQRFAMSAGHNPLYLAPLCKQHHEIAHTIDVRVAEKRGGSF